MGDAVTSAAGHGTPLVRDGAVISAGSRILVAITGTALTIVVAHVLGPAGLGAFVMAQTLVVIALVFSTLGAEHGIVYFVSSGRWDPLDAIATSERLALVCGVAAGAVCMALRVLLPKAFDGLSVPLTAACAGSLPLVLAWFYASYVALATGSMGQFAGVPATQSAFALVLVGGLAALDGTTGAVIGFAASQVVTSVVWVPSIWRRLIDAPTVSSTSTGSLRHALSFGTRGWAANALQSINYRLDLFVLSAVSARVVVGQYSVAVSVTSVLWLLPQALGDALYPAISRLGRLDPASQRAQTESKGLRHCALLTLLVSLLLAVVLVVLVIPVFGPSFRPSIGQGLTLLPGAALLAMTNPLAAIIAGRGRPDVLLRTAAVVVPVTVGLYLLLIPRLHGEGAALGSTLSYCLSFVLMAAAYGRLAKTSALRQMLPTRSEFSDYRVLLRQVIDRASSGDAE